MSLPSSDYRNSLFAPALKIRFIPGSFVTAEMAVKAYLTYPSGSATETYSATRRAAVLFDVEQVDVPHTAHIKRWEY